MLDAVELLDEPSVLNDEESKISLVVIEARVADGKLVVTLLLLLKPRPPAAEVLIVELTGELVDSLRDCP